MRYFLSGTLRKNRKGNPKALVNAKLKKGEAVYRRNGNVLCLKWCEKKRSVTMTTTIHSAVYVEVKKRGREGKYQNKEAISSV